MIINSLCNTCLQPFTIILTADDARLVKQIADESGHTAPCPRMCGGHINLIGDPVISSMAEDPRLREPMTITGLELFQAVGGMGLPDEIPKDLTVIEALLKSNPIKTVSLEKNEVNGKFYLHEMHLEGGIVFHLAAGARGAQILKITKERANGPAPDR